MGVEYRHYVVVKDLSWRPTADTAKRVDEVLRRWKAVGDITKVVDCSREQAGKILDAEVAFNRAPGEGLLFEWDTDEVESESVRLIAGPSIFGPDEEMGRYFQGISVLIGSDYRVHPSSETACAEVSTGAIVDGNEIEAVEFEEVVSERTNLPYLEYFPMSGSGQPPKVDMDFMEMEPAVPFSGVWTGALIIDFGKDLAEFVNEQSPQLPNRQFVAELQHAFGAELIEVGEGH